MRTPSFCLCLTLVAASLAGCFPRSRVGFFDEHAFYSTREHMRVRYLPGGEAQRALMSAGWRLENFRADDEGRPTEPKSGSSYEIVRALDRDGDGRVDLRARSERWDLRFDHLHDDVEIWVRSAPLERSIAERTLAATTRDLVTAFVSDDAPRRLDRPQVRLGARIVEEGDATFGRTPAYRVVFEVHDLDRPADDPGRVGALVYFVLARPDARWSAGGGPGGDGDLPMLVLFGYGARPDVFVTHRAEFEGLLDRVDFR